MSIEQPRRRTQTLPAAIDNDSVELDRGNSATCSDCQNDRLGMGSFLNPISSSNIKITSRGWSLSDVESYPNFIRVPRVSALNFDEEATQTRIEQYEKNGIPCIIEGYHKHPKWTDILTPEWLREHGPKDISVRNIHNYTDSQMPMEEFITKCRDASPFIEPNETERLYGKDVVCPPEWEQWIADSEVIPSRLLPGGENDLLKVLPENATVETLMCYLGIGDTFTPSHKDLCASSGHNLLVYTESDGSSFWFMTKSDDARIVTEYFHTLNQELDHETHVTTLNEWKRAPFKIYVAEQKLGDLVLVPPRSCHQVVNYGGITVKVSWSRMTFDGLVTALYHELPLYRRVCRLETYRVKSTFYLTLRKYIRDLNTCTDLDKRAPLVERLSFACQVFDDVLLQEYDPGHATMHFVSKRHDDVCDLSCDFCGADIFQSYFGCLDCVPAEAWEDGCVICPGCYIEGRSCRCGKMEPVQFRDFSALKKVRISAQETLQRIWKTGIGQPVSFESEESLFDGTRGTFRAGCLSARYRKTQDGRRNRVCSGMSERNPSHDAPSYGVIQCKDCHRTKCLPHHLIHNKLHAINVTLQREYHPKNHHQFHKDARNKYDPGLESFSKSEELGSRPDSDIQWVNLALSFGTCKPFRPEHLCLGWYDKDFVPLQVSITSMPSIRDVLKEQSPLPSAPTAGPSTRRIRSSSEAFPEVSSRRPAKKRRRRMLLDCVLVLNSASFGYPLLRLPKDYAYQISETGTEEDTHLLENTQAGSHRGLGDQSEQPIPGPSRPRGASNGKRSAVKKPVAKDGPSTSSPLPSGLKFHKIKRNGDASSQQLSMVPQSSMTTSNSNPTLRSDLGINTRPREDLENMVRDLLQ
ncbi:hypothetical protein D9758_000647 [Tetrapyrgos nigripes]|uniref:JmjC domain-containing protein n=1 Tax=Tetrapyrgos nigripes TaxID=182062 RepID=A0A8H5GZM6_9AGAR|nr:hypothetical protein D9758_000647 [Tetrapyrgos nigripes]